MECSKRHTPAFLRHQSQKTLFISPAAAFVNVITKISEGEAILFFIRFSILRVITVVLPDPGRQVLTWDPHDAGLPASERHLDSVS